MPIIAVEGVGKVELGDEFNSLTPEQQDATIQGIAHTAKQPQEAKPSDGGWRSYIPSEIADIPSEIGNAFSENLAAAKEGFAGDKAAQGTIGGLFSTGKGLLAIPGMAMSLVTGPARSVGGHLLTRAIHGAGSLLNPEVAAKDDQQKIYDEVKGEVDKAVAAATPSRGVPAKFGLGPRDAPSIPQPPTPQTGPLNVMLSEGQTTRELPAIQTEQAALRGTSGPSAQARAQEFADQQRAQVSGAKDAVVSGLDQFGQKIVDGPQQAAELAQKSIQSAAAQRKAGVTQAYDEAKSLPGEIHAGAFEGIVPKIKHELSLGDNPIVVDELTPRANKALGYIENQISNLKIKNRADPFGQPNPENIVGISLKGVEQWRKNLVAMRNDAFASGNGADGRAMRGVVKAFDEQVDNAINGGLFNGDPRAVQAWNDARAAHADYKSTFSAGNGDPVGRVVERILGKDKNPAAIPNDVADFIYGGSGVNPGSLNVAVAKRVRGILGDQSPEWSGIKQGLFSRLVETPEGVTDLGPGKIAQRLNQFLNGNGKEMAETIFSPAERSLLRQYSDLHRALEIPQAGANWSNTATFLAPLLKSASNRMTSLVVGALTHIPVVGKAIGPLAGAAVDNMGGIISNAKNAQQIAKQMPLITEAAQKFRNAVAAYNKSNSPPSKVALSVATANMARAFKNIGIDLAAQAPSVSRAGDNPEIPRPPGQ